jgi:hypothetical protein
MTVKITYENYECIKFLITLNTFSNSESYDFREYRENKLPPSTEYGDIEEIRINKEPGFFSIWYINKDRKTVVEQIYPFSAILSTEVIWK